MSRKRNTKPGKSFSFYVPDPYHVDVQWCRDHDKPVGEWLGKICRAERHDHEEGLNALSLEKALELSSEFDVIQKHLESRIGDMQKARKEKKQDLLGMDGEAKEEDEKKVIETTFKIVRNILARWIRDGVAKNFSEGVILLRSKRNSKIIERYRLIVGLEAEEFIEVFEEWLEEKKDIIIGQTNEL